MKKFILFILCLFLLCSCTMDPKEVHNRLQRSIQDECTLIDLSFPDEYGQMKTHQVVYYYNGGIDSGRSGLMHWPDCKYCKKGL